jgi:hypothetical protein
MPRAYRLRPIEKRSIVYARLPAELKCFQPTNIAYIPYATMAWIESLLKKGGTDWPWFAAVLKFINSNAYREIEASLLGEIEQIRSKKQAFYDSLRSHSPHPLPSPVPDSTSSLNTSWHSVRPKDDRPYFWESIDTLAWRDQE